MPLRSTSRRFRRAVFSVVLLALGLAQTLGADAPHRPRAAGGAGARRRRGAAGAARARLAAGALRRPRHDGLRSLRSAQPCRPARRRCRSSSRCTTLPEARDSAHADLAHRRPGRGLPRARSALGRLTRRGPARPPPCRRVARRRSPAASRGGRLSPAEERPMSVRSTAAAAFCVALLVPLSAQRRRQRRPAQPSASRSISSRRPTKAASRRSRRACATCSSASMPAPCRCRRRSAARRRRAGAHAAAARLRPSGACSRSRVPEAPARSGRPAARRLRRRPSIRRSR